MINEVTKPSAWFYTNPCLYVWISFECLFLFFLFVFFSYLSQLLRYNGIDSVEPFYLFYFNCITRMIDLDLHVL